LTPRRNSKDQLAGVPIQISYKMTKKRTCTQSGIAKTSFSNKNPVQKTQTHNKSNFGKPMFRFYKKHNLASKLFLFNKETQVEIFFESVFGKSKCDCPCSPF
jgi:hypothetical protein